MVGFHDCSNEAQNPTCFHHYYDCDELPIYLSSLSHLVQVSHLYLSPIPSHYAFVLKKAVVIAFHHENVDAYLEGECVVKEEGESHEERAHKDYYHGKGCSKQRKKVEQRK